MPGFVVQGHIWCVYIVGLWWREVDKVDSWHHFLSSTLMRT